MASKKFVLHWYLIGGLIAGILGGMWAAFEGTPQIGGIGTFIIIAVGLVIGIVGISINLARNKIIKETVELVVNVLERMDVPRHEYQLIDLQSFQHSDLTFYDDASHLLTEYGFVYVGDEEIAGLNGTFFEIPTFFRRMIGENGSVIADLCHLQSRLVNQQFHTEHGIKTVEFETEFSDGSFIETSNIEMTFVETPPHIYAEYLPIQTPILDVLERHKHRITAYQETHKNVHPLAITTLADIHDSRNRQQRIRAEFRKAVGGITKTELEQMVPGKKHFIRKIYREIQKKYRNGEKNLLRKKT